MWFTVTCSSLPVHKLLPPEGCYKEECGSSLLSSSFAAFSADWFILAEGSETGDWEHSIDMKAPSTAPVVLEAQEDEDLKKCFRSTLMIPQWARFQATCRSRVCSFLYQTKIGNQIFGLQARVPQMWKHLEFNVAPMWCNITGEM